QLCSSTHHLAKRPERDAGSIGRRPSGMPVDGFNDSVEILLKLPGEPALADPRLTHDGDEARPAIPRRRVEQLPEQAQLILAADERRLEALDRVTAATIGHDAKRAPS